MNRAGPDRPRASSHGASTGRPANRLTPAFASNSQWRSTQAARVDNRAAWRSASVDRQLIGTLQQSLPDRAGSRLTRQRAQEVDRPAEGREIAGTRRALTQVSGDARRLVLVKLVSQQIRELAPHFLVRELGGFDAGRAPAPLAEI